MAEESGEPVRPEVLVTQTLLAKLRIENWLTFLTWLQSKFTKSQATGAKTSDEIPSAPRNAE